MVYKEVSKNSYGSRIGKSIKGIGIGFGLIILSVYILWWNEGRTIDVYNGLNETQKITIVGDISKVNPEFEGKVVYNNGDITVSGDVEDEITGFSDRVVKILRKVETYQRKESKSTDSKDNLGGSETVTTTYKYSKIWNEGKIDSTSFKESGHENNFQVLYSSKDIISDKVSFGEMKLDNDFINKLYKSEEVKLLEDNLAKFKEKGAPENIKIDTGYFYIGSGSIAEPKVGDTRISYSIVKPAEVSIIGIQKGDTISPYKTSKDTTVSLLQYGLKSQDEMFEIAEQDNKYLAWVIRIVGLGMMLIGFNMMLGILPILAKVVPFVSSIIGFGTFLISLILTIIVGFSTIIIAWLFVRPILSISLIVLAGIAVFGVLYFKKEKNETK